ncbi:MAG: DUF1697 domain-containing protein [Acidobacteria bacterium]|nr:DUF1697 domain-containing protein [Acidobacteriota bacterium]
MRHIALLRGINVGGNTLIKMEELRAMFEALRFGNVKSYINSGNLAFDSVSSPQVSKGKPPEVILSNQIESAIQTTFGKAVPVMVREQRHIQTVLESNPFAGQFGSHKEMHVLFLKEEMPDDKVQQLVANQTKDERFAVLGHEIFCHLKFGVADSLLGKGFIDKKLKIAYTARNWRTVEKLATL